LTTYDGVWTIAGLQIPRMLSPIILELLVVASQAKSLS